MLKKSFVIHLCCLKKYSVREINNFPKRYRPIYRSKILQLLIINTYHGLFQYTRLQFEVKTAPTIYQQIMETMLTGVEGVAAYLDGIIVVDQSKQDLTKRTNKVLTCFQDFGFQLRPESVILLTDN